MIDRLLIASNMIEQDQRSGKANYIHIPLSQIEQWAKEEGTTTEEIIDRLERQLNPTREDGIE